MKKKRKLIEKKTIMIIVILIILIGITFIIYAQKANNNSTEFKKLGNCIGKNSILYVQEGCNACHVQLNHLQEIKEHLKIIDCREEWSVCSQKGIRVTPTWEIKGELVTGIQSLEKIQQLTNC